MFLDMPPPRTHHKAMGLTDYVVLMMSHVSSERHCWQWHKRKINLFRRGLGRRCLLSTSHTTRTPASPSQLRIKSRTDAGARALCKIQPRASADMTTSFADPVIWMPRFGPLSRNTAHLQSISCDFLGQILRLVSIFTGFRVRAFSIF